MRSVTVGTTRFHYNPDLSGDVIINIPPAAITAAEPDVAQVTVDGATLRQFIVDALRDKATEDRSRYRDDLDHYEPVIAGYDGQLYGAAPDCTHEVVAQWSGVKCRLCPGWFCH